MFRTLRCSTTCRRSLRVRPDENKLTVRGLPDYGSNETSFVFGQRFASEFPTEHVDRNQREERDTFCLFH
ncbi:hypothetical protein VZT92_010393 [Zoarces viviparus]|uniref:Uncharacterized protein n=1 Tax=Zoarces viviparus TaxID=48416 RepID=A0AAW1FDS9_ZOAVI